MRKNTQLMLSEISSVLNIHFTRLRCNDSILIVSSTGKCHEGPKDNSDLPVINESCISLGHTAYESFSNHFHLYAGKIRRSEYQTLRKISISTGQNVYEKLLLTYPNCRFRLYVEINVNEGIVLRFHQIWPGELPFYSDSMIENSKLSKKFQIYLFASPGSSANRG